MFGSTPREHLFGSTLNFCFKRVDTVAAPSFFFNGGELLREFGSCVWCRELPEAWFAVPAPRIHPAFLLRDYGFRLVSSPSRLAFSFLQMHLGVSVSPPSRLGFSACLSSFMISLFLSTDVFGGFCLSSFVIHSPFVRL